MRKMTTGLLIGAALLATAACTKKPPENIPPGPGPITNPDNSNNNNGGQDMIRPGSAADFKRSIMSDTIHFAFDQYDIDDEARAVLDSQARWLVQYPNVRITIEGHCDERGTREYNLALGDRRANAAKNYLASRGVSASRITTISYGKERPLALGSDEESWAANRRAVTIVLN
ncbi:MAG: peptidoglycan-associated lipoprotein Pal [Pseudomonadota bacterium]